MEKPDEGYDSTGEVGSLLIVVALLYDVVDCRSSQESGLLINHIEKTKSSDLHQKARGRRRSRRRARDSSRRERLHREEVFFDKRDSDAVLTQS